jgi:hypothetical protein
MPRNGEEIVVGGELGDFEIAEKQEVEEVGEGGTEEGHVSPTGPSRPRDGEPAP